MVNVCTVIVELKVRTPLVDCLLLYSTGEQSPKNVVELFGTGLTDPKVCQCPIMALGVRVDSGGLVAIGGDFVAFCFNYQTAHRQ